MFDYLRALLAARTDRGASAVEYGLLVAGVILACIFGLEALGLVVRAVFSEQNSNISGP